MCFANGAWGGITRLVLVIQRFCLAECIPMRYN